MSIIDDIMDAHREGCIDGYTYDKLAMVLELDIPKKNWNRVDKVVEHIKTYVDVFDVTTGDMTINVVLR